MPCRALCRYQSHKPIIVETDSSFVVSLLANDFLDRSPFVDIKRQAPSIMKLTNDFKICKINCNTAAHEIAKFSFDNRSDGLLYYSVPPCVVYSVMNDCKNFLSWLIYGVV